MALSEFGLLASCGEWKSGEIILRSNLQKGGVIQNISSRSCNSVETGKKKYIYMSGFLDFIIRSRWGNNGGLSLSIFSISRQIGRRRKRVRPIDLSPHPPFKFIKKPCNVGSEPQH